MDLLPVHWLLSSCITCGFKNARRQTSGPAGDTSLLERNDAAHTHSFTREEQPAFNAGPPSEGFFALNEHYEMS
jgi:hypothetical protein